jgi:glutathione S-transferase
MLESMGYVVYGLRLSYFTRKLEAALELMGVPFESRSKTLAVREEVERRSGTHQMPVLHTPENWMVADTTPQLDLLDGRFPKRRLFPVGPPGVLVHVLEEYLDEWLPRTVIHYRWNHQESENFAAPRMAAETLPDVDPEAQNAIASALADWGRRACRATGVSGETQQRAAEAEMDRVLGALDDQLGRTPYALGGRPCAVDAVLLGALRAHLLTDPVPRARYANLQRILAWSERAHRWDGTGELAPWSEPTPFARLLLDEMAGPYRAFILGNAAALASDAKAFTVQVYGEDVSYRTRPYPERSRQMVRDRIRHRLDDTERAQIQGWLESVRLADVFG